MCEELVPEEMREAPEKPEKNEVLDEEIVSEIHTSLLYGDMNGLRLYTITGVNDAGNEIPPGQAYNILSYQGFNKVEFQQGDVQVVGINGLTNQAMLAILIHRLEWANQDNPCEENEQAQRALEVAWMHLELAALKRRFHGEANQA